MSDLDVMYRIMILYMLNRVEYPLTNIQIVDFAANKNIADYFSIQLAISGLVSSGMISAEHTHNDTRYHILEDGRRTLSLLDDNITDGLKATIDEYFRENDFELKKQTSVYADYMRATGGGYLVRCQVKNIEKSVIDLNLTVPTKEQAEAICANWMDAHTDVYAAIMDNLIK